MTAGLIAW